MVPAFVNPQHPPPLTWAARDLQRRRNTRVAISAVVNNVDLLSIIMCGNTGPSGLNAASLVCKTWLSVCRTDERVLRSVALYQGGVTKSVFMQLFAVTSKQADDLPRTKHSRFGSGAQYYYLYREVAVDAVLAAGGMPALRERLRLRGDSAQPTAYRSPSMRIEIIHLTAAQEGRLHAKAISAYGVCSVLGKRARWRIPPHITLPRCGLNGLGG